MAQTRHVVKRLKTEECTSCVESVLFNSDSLFKIASYLPADCLLNLALTCRRFGSGGDDCLSLVEETARRVVHVVATDEEMAALPRDDGDNWICKYNYLQSLRAPLTYDQLVGQGSQYVDGNRSRVANRQGPWATAISNNIMMAGKHYASFKVRIGFGVSLGVTRPGEAMQSAKYSPLAAEFYNNFTQSRGSVRYNNSINCCMYRAFDGNCLSSDWGEDIADIQQWDGMERLSVSGSFKVGMLLDLDEGTLSVYKNDRKLGVMKRGLAGHYCWVVAIFAGTQVTIKRGIVPAS